MPGQLRRLAGASASPSAVRRLCLLSLAAVGVVSGALLGPLPDDVAHQLLYKEPNDHLQKLGEISDTEGSLVRTFLSPAHVRAATMLSELMEAAGMRTWVDGVGNVHGRIDGKTEGTPALIMGSHYDTVVDGGKYDGALGIIVPIAAAKALVAQLNAQAIAECTPKDERLGKCAIDEVAGQIKLERPYEIIAFADEEGVRFGSTFLGSRAIAGTLVEHGLLSSNDKSGLSLAEVLDSMGYNGTAEAVTALVYRPEDVYSYLEVHMEQGPVLESKGVPLGAVSGIAGQTRLYVTMSGMQGHAGTVPMKIRQDCIASAAEAIAWMERRCGGGNYEEVHPKAAQLTDANMLVCTTGAMSIWPGASNVISGSVNFTIDIRSAHNDVRQAAVEDVRGHIHALCRRRGISCEVQQSHEAQGVLSDPEMVQNFLDAAKLSQDTLASVLSVEHGQGMGERGMKVVEPADVPVLVSGAGHDALAMADLTKVGMVFVRCGNNGISHSPLEYVAPDDVAAVTAALFQYLQHELL